MREIIERSGVDSELAKRFAKDYPNLSAVMSGCVSGRHTEWPLIRAELKRLAVELGRPVGLDHNEVEGWTWPCNTVGRFMGNLSLLPRDMPLCTAYFVEIEGKQVARTIHPSVSKETVHSNRVQRWDPHQQTLVIWATQDAGSGQWVHCSPDLINAGVSCEHTPRRDCACGLGGSHDHWIAHHRRKV